MPLFFPLSFTFSFSFLFHFVFVQVYSLSLFFLFYIYFGILVSLPNECQVQAISSSFRDSVFSPLLPPADSCFPPSLRSAFQTPLHFSPFINHVAYFHFLSPPAIVFDFPLITFSYLFPLIPLHSASNYCLWFYSPVPSFNIPSFPWLSLPFLFFPSASSRLCLCLSILLRPQVSGCTWLLHLYYSGEMRMNPNLVTRQGQIF